jgi:hypothetical protein
VSSSSIWAVWGWEGISDEPLELWSDHRGYRAQSVCLVNDHVPKLSRKGREVGGINAFPRTNMSDAGSNPCSMSELASKRQLSRGHSGKAAIRPGNESAHKQSLRSHPWLGLPGWTCVCFAFTISRMTETVMLFMREPLAENFVVLWKTVAPGKIIPSAELALRRRGRRVPPGAAKRLPPRLTAQTQKRSRAIRPAF